jgi:hypothetical protein
MEFLLQLLAQLFAAPVEDTNQAVQETAKAAEILQAEEEVETVVAEEQMEPNLFNVMDFH